MPRFSIIIVSWNALHHLKTYLPSVAASSYDDYEIILADNASGDGSKAWVREHYPDVKIVSYDHNYGYCGGNNRAVPYADGDVLIFLNNDVEVTPDWLQPLGRLFRDHPEMAAAQPKMRSYEERDHFEYAGAAGGFIDRYGYPYCRGRLFDTLEKDSGQYDEAIPIFWASGAALAIRKDVFQETGGFDSDFQFHMEEIDLCWRLWNRGHSVWACPESVVYHLGGGSLPMDSPRKTYYNYRNSLKMLWKNYTRSSLLLRFPVRLALDLASSLRELAKGDLRVFKAIVKAHLHFWKSLGRVHSKRKKLYTLRSAAGEPEVMQSRSIIRDYFIKGIRNYSDLS